MDRDSVRHRSARFLMLSILIASGIPSPSFADDPGRFTLYVAPLTVPSELLRLVDSAPLDHVGLAHFAEPGPAEVGQAALPKPEGPFGRPPLRRGSWEAGVALAYSISGVGGRPKDTEIRAVWLLPRFGYTFWDVPWYPASLQVYLEPAVAFVTRPDESILVGASLMLRHTFLYWRLISPFIELGAGLANNDLNFSGLAGPIVFMLQVGVGFHLHLSERLSLTTGYRFHHFSNAGIEKPNLDVNSHFPYVGVTYFF